MFNKVKKVIFENLIYLFLSLILSTIVAMEINFLDQNKLGDAVSISSFAICETIDSVWIRSNCKDWVYDKKLKECNDLKKRDLQTYKICKENLKVPNNKGALTSKIKFISFILLLFVFFVYALKLVKRKIIDRFE